MTMLVVLLLFVLAAGCDTNPTGPVVNNSGDNNAFSIGGSGDEGSEAGDITTPAPVVVQPVVVTPPATPEPAS